MKQKCILILLLLGLVSSIYGQHLAYSEILVNGKLDQMGECVMSKGFRLVDKDFFMDTYKGVSSLTKDSVKLTVRASPISKTVFRLRESYDSKTSKKADVLFKKITKALGKKYTIQETSTYKQIFVVYTPDKQYIGRIIVEDFKDGVVVNYWDVSNTLKKINEDNIELTGYEKNSVILDHMLFYGISMGTPSKAFKDSLLLHNFHKNSNDSATVSRSLFAGDTPTDIQLYSSKKGTINKIVVPFICKSEQEAKVTYNDLRSRLDTIIEDHDKFDESFTVYNVSNFIGESVGSITLRQVKDSVSLVYRDVRGSFDTADEALANKDKRHHLTFMGVPINGNVIPFISRLTSDRNFQVIEKKDGCLWLYNKNWAGENDVQFLLAHYSKKQYLYALQALVRCSGNDVGMKFQNFTDLFERKLGTPDIDDNDGYRYYVNAWGRRVGSIYLQIKNQHLIGITYYDSENTSKMLNDENKDLF